MTARAGAGAPLTIAYDLRYADRHFTGIGTHAYALLAALLELPGDERYRVLWNPAITGARYDLAPLRAHPRVEWCEVPIPTLHPLEPLRIGAHLRARRADLYYSPYFLMPIGAPCPAIVTIHDVWPLRMPEGLSWVRNRIYRACLALARNARFVYTSSRFSRGEIVRLLGLPEARVRYVRLGVPPAGAPAAEVRPAAVPDGAFALVVGDNRPRKNLAVLASAWARMGERPPVQLVVAGPEDPRYPAIAALARAAGAGGVHALGWIAEGELAWLYAHASMVLFPSRYEGFGFPMVEAFARGLPVVASDIPTLREIGEDVARFVDPDDAGAWAGAVAGLVGDADARGRARVAGRERAAALSYRATAEESLALFREAAGR